MARIKPGRVYGGDYEVVRELARGGFGAVFVARQHSTGRERALKVMLPQLIDGAKARERFLREAKIGASIPSTHVVEVLASGIDVEDETPWLVMELLQGETLHARLERVGRLSPRDTLAVLTEAGHALREAHARGIFHLDLKPENLFFARSQSARGQDETLKVLDFGIARIAAEARHSATVTSGVGSVLWMAPEQVARGFKVSPASDVWALGLIAFRALSGKYYWSDANVAPGEQISNPAVLLELTAGALDPASVRARALGAPGALPEGFDAWFARCVCRDPALRFAEAGAAVDALRAVLTDRPAPPSTEPLRAAPIAPPIAARTEPMPPFVPTPPRPVQGAAAARAFAPTPASSRGKFVALGAGLLGVGVVVAFALAGGGRGGGGEPARDAGAPSPTPVPVPAPAPAAPEPQCPGGMVKIPAGRFRMGSPGDAGQADEHPEHEVEVPRAFCMDRTEVTVAAFQACRNAGGCTTDPTTHNPRQSTSRETNYDYFCTWGHTGFEQHPVNCVDWDQARAFCAWSGHTGGARRLPTEAEWEYAARGSAGRTYAWGNALEAGRANFCGTECVAAARRIGISFSPFPNWSDAYDFTAPVGSLPLGNTPEGLADMTGNVWEWVEDAYDANAYSHRPQGFNARVGIVDASGQNSSRVIRGGSWFVIDASRVRASYRYGYARSLRLSGVGFRCARDI